MGHSFRQGQSARAAATCSVFRPTDKTTRPFAADAVNLPQYQSKMGSLSLQSTPMKTTQRK
jgi:hypothetical protein